VTLQANGVRVRYPVGVRTLLDSNLMISGTAESTHLTGKVQLNGLSFTNEFDLSRFLSYFDSQETSSSSQGFMQNVDLDVSLSSTDELTSLAAKSACKDRQTCD
jgi:hypothetical protein